MLDNLKKAFKQRVKFEWGSWKDKTMWLSAILGAWGGIVCISFVEVIILKVFKSYLPEWFILTFSIIYTLILYGKMYIYFDSMKKQPKDLNSFII